MDQTTTPTLGRREALARLGLSAVVAYVAPTILHLDRQAGAVQPSCTGKGKGKGNPWCKGKGARDRAWDDWRDRHGSRYVYGSSGTDRRDGHSRAGFGGSSHRSNRNSDPGRDSSPGKRR